MLQVPILTHVKIERDIVPVLHLQLGLTNWIMKDFFNYVDAHLEELPDELGEARNRSFEATVKEEEAKSEWVQWGLENDPELAYLCLDHILINQWLSVERTEENYQELLDTKESINKEIGPIAAAKKALKVKLEKTEKARQVVENVLKKLEGKHGSVMSKSLHGLLEEMLKAK
jgi:hypothetical protein